MVKFITLLYGNPGLSEEQFRKHWLEIHGPLVAKYKLHFGIVKYTQDHLIKLPGFTYHHDNLLGIAELWHDSLESHNKMVNDQEFFKAMMEDAKLFSGEDDFYMVDEKIII
jgi:uncharacterized protein (TIGR02118 family)